MGYGGNYSKQWVICVFHVFSAYLKVWGLSGNYRWSYDKLRKLKALFIIFNKVMTYSKIVLNIVPRSWFQVFSSFVDAWRISGPYPIDWIFSGYIEFRHSIKASESRPKVHFCTYHYFSLCQNVLYELMSMLFLFR